MHNLATRAARFMSVCGGLVLALLIVLICISVIGRSLNGLLHGWFGTVLPTVSAFLLQAGVGPINGDFELVEAGVAFSIFAFLPLCQISGGHASVDIFTSKLPKRVKRFLQMLIDTVFAIVLIVLAYQLYRGMLSKQSYGDTTFLAAISNLVGLCGEPCGGCYGRRDIGLCGLGSDYGACNWPRCNNR